jgi:hypothetical protein
VVGLVIAVQDVPLMGLRVKAKANDFQVPFLELNEPRFDFDHCDTVGEGQVSIDGQRQTDCQGAWTNPTATKRLSAENARLVAIPGKLTSLVKVPLSVSPHQIRLPFAIPYILPSGERLKWSGTLAVSGFGCNSVVVSFFWRRMSQVVS